MRPGNTVRVSTYRVRGEDRADTDDLVATEEPMEIRVYYYKDGVQQKTSLSVTMRTPGNDFELAAGFMFTEGIVHSREEIERISYCVDGAEEQQYNIVNVYLSGEISFDPSKLQRHFYTSSSCGVCGKGSLDVLRVSGCPVIRQEGPFVTDSVIKELPGKLRRAQNIFSKTGGLHAAALFDEKGSLVELREDVGRHNAVDKLIGSKLLAGKVPLSKYVLQVSGRTSFEILQKALVAGIPVVSAVGAPSSLAVGLASDFGMTLIGFVSEKGFNIYTGRSRILISNPQDVKVNVS